MPPAWKVSVFGFEFFGGHASYFRQTFVPVSNIHASGGVPVAFAFQEMLEERQLDVLAKVERGFRVESNVAKLVAVLERSSHHEPTGP